MFQLSYSLHSIAAAQTAQRVHPAPNTTHETPPHLEQVSKVTIIRLATNNPFISQPHVSTCPPPPTSACMGRYHYLLGRPLPQELVALSSAEQESSPDRTVLLYHVFQCLFSPGVSPGVSNAVLELTLNLLGDDQGPSPHGMETAASVESVEAAVGASSVGDGAGLVSHFIPTLLEYLGQKVRAVGEKADSHGQTGLQLEFTVLSR